MSKNQSYMRNTTNHVIRHISTEELANHLSDIGWSTKQFSSNCQSVSQPKTYCSPIFQCQVVTDISTKASICTKCLVKVIPFTILKVMFLVANVFSVPFFNQFKVSNFSTIDIVIRQNLKGREAALEIKKKMILESKYMYVLLSHNLPTIFQKFLADIIELWNSQFHFFFSVILFGSCLTCLGKNNWINSLNRRVTWHYTN